MGDDHHKPPPPRPSRVVTFSSRLCVIAWVCAVAFELLPKGGALRSLSLLFGSHAGALGLVAAIVFWLLRRQAVLFIVIVATAPPVAYFGVVIWNIVKLRNSVDG